MSKRFRLVLSAAFAVLALMGCLAYGGAVRAEVEADRAEALEKYGGEVATIIVAADNLEAGEVVSSRNCVERDWVASLVPEGAVTSLDAIVGRTLTSPISRGTPLTEVALRDSTETLDIPSGMAAYTVTLNERTGVPASVALGTNLIAYRVVDGQTALISTDVMVIGQDPEGQSRITVAVPYDDISELIQAATDRSLRLVQPSSEAGELGDVTALMDEVPPSEGAVDEGAGAEGDVIADGAAAGGDSPAEGDAAVEDYREDDLYAEPEGEAAEGGAEALDGWDGVQSGEDGEAL